MKPYSENIVFFDTEFSTLNPYEGEILSLGLVKFSGEELYVEVEHRGAVAPWVEKHVAPYFSGEKVSRQEAVRRVREFIGGGKPYVVANVNQYDTLYWYKLLGQEQENPFNWLPVDFTSMVFALGLDPQWKQNRRFLAGLGIDSALYRSHHALDDARLLREVYLKLLKS